MKVLFVCTGNRFRSLGAEALARSMDTSMEFFSRGTNPSQEITDAVKQELGKRGLEEEAVYRPQKLSGEDLEEADTVVAMTSGHVDYIRENFDSDIDVVNWEIPDVSADLPDEELRREVSETYDLLDEKVENLIRRCSSP